MRERISLFAVCLVIAVATSAGFAQDHRIFVQAAGQSPVGVPPEGINLSVMPGEMITLDVYIERMPAPMRMIGCQATLPCQFAGGTAGSIEIVPFGVSNDLSRPDFCFFGPRYCDSGTNVGLVCANDAGCPMSPPGNDCIIAQSFPVIDQGMCPVAPPPAEGNPRVATAAGIGVPAIVLNDTTGPCNFGTFMFQVSPDAAGTFTLVVPNEPDSASRNEMSMPVPFVTSGVTVTIALPPTGQCCMGIECLGDLTEAACAAAGGIWNPIVSCTNTPCACTSNNQCEDNNACTSNVCQGGTCTFPSNVPSGQCCTPATGQLNPINDNNECTTDSCDAGTGVVSHAPVADGTTCTDDGNPCTLNRCMGGACGALDITTIPCTVDADCVSASGGASQSCGSITPGFCDCVANPPLTIECAASVKPDLCVGGTNDGATCMGGSDCPGGSCVAQMQNTPDCFSDGEKVTLRVVLGGGTLDIVGGQFQLRYDPTCLDFRAIAPGTQCDDASPFGLELFSSVNEAEGEIFFAVGVALSQNNGTNGGGVMACVSFDKIGACSECEVCFGDENPQNTYLSGMTGDPIEPDLPNGGCGCNVRTKGVTTLTVPQGGTFNADCDEPTASVTWASPAAGSNTCDGALDVVCTCAHSNPLVTPGECATLVAHGGDFPQGTAEFCCSATDSCGQRSESCWEVTVSDQTTMNVVVQLSPTMTPNPLTRCIEFAFYSNCVESPELFQQALEFGPPWDFPGHAGYELKVPKGQYSCITARDPLHTLRAKSDVSCVDGILHAEFKGDPFFGGNWLQGGNLNGDHVIDILDFGVIVGQYLKPLEPNTDCDEASQEDFLHADINGDGIVDSLDFNYIQNNFLDEDKEACCPEDGGGASLPPGRTSITVQELYAMGLRRLAQGDLNGDGVLDAEDIGAMLSGQVPAGLQQPVGGSKASRR